MVTGQPGVHGVHVQSHVALVITQGQGRVLIQRHFMEGTTARQEMRLILVVVILGSTVQVSFCFIMQVLYNVLI